MTQVKASFDDCYNVYSPREYTSRIVNDINYDLPFNTASLLREYLSDHTTQVNTVIFGSGHGLDAAALKYRYSHQDILDLWLEKDPLEHIFQGGDSRFKITMADLYEQPLKFAQNVGLCESFYACNLTEEWPQELLAIMSDSTDLLLCIGVTTYLGEDTFRKIVKLVESSDIQYFCFSVISLIQSSFLSILEDSNLKVNRLGRFRQRDYADANEQEKIINILSEEQVCSPEDRQCLMTSVYVASKA